MTTLNRSPRTTTESVVETLSSGEDFSRLYWQIMGSYMKESEEALGLKQAQGTGDFEYAINHEFYLLLSGGYQSITSSTILSQKLTGPIAYGGLRVKFSELSMFEVRAGESYNSASYIGSAVIAFTPQTGLTGSLTDTIQTPAGLLLNNLANLDVSVQNSGAYQFYNSTTVVPNQSPSSLQGFSVTPQDNLGFNNEIERFRTGAIGLHHNFPDQTQVLLNGFGTIADILSAVPANEQPRQTSWGGSLSAQKPLSPYLNVSGFVSWGDQDISFGHDQYLSVGATANYNLSKTLSVYGQVEYYSRFSGSHLAAVQAISGDADVATFTIGVTKSF